MELHQKLIDYIESEVTGLYAPISAVPLPEGREAISITICPSRYVKEYFDNTVLDTMLIQITAKSGDSIKALKAVTDIAHTLEKAPKNAVTSDTGAFCFDRCRIYSNPNLAYMEPNQVCVFVSLVNVFYIRR